MEKTPSPKKGGDEEKTPANWNLNVDLTNEVAEDSSYRAYFANKLVMQQVQRGPLQHTSGESEGCEDISGEGQEVGGGGGLLGLVSQLKVRWSEERRKAGVKEGWREGRLERSDSSISPTTITNNPFRARFAHQRRKHQKSGTSSSNKKAKRAKRSELFKGIVVLCNGCVRPSNVEIERIMNENGGKFVMGTIETPEVTHVLCPTVSYAKAEIIKKRKSSTQKFYVKPEWVVDSLKKGKVLDIAPYIIEAVKHVKGIMDVAEALAGSLCKKVSPLDGAGSNMTAKTSRKTTTTKTAKTNTTTTTVSSSTAGISNSCGNRTCGTDPNFLQEYWSNSRLSYIGRHLQRQKKPSSPTKLTSAGTQNSITYVFHIDMDYFFASVLLRDKPHLQDKAVAVGHETTKNGELSTCNIAARRAGVKKGMWLKKARELCPDLVVLNYDYDLFNEVRVDEW